MFRLGGYGYSGIVDKGVNDAMPKNSGITKLDMQTKKVELLVSVRQVAECGGASSGVSHHYLTHLCLNPSCTRCPPSCIAYFMGGWRFDDPTDECEYRRYWTSLSGARISQPL